MPSETKQSQKTTPRTGIEIALHVLKNEHARLSRLAEKLDNDANEITNAHKEVIEIHKEWNDVVKNTRQDPSGVLKKLSALNKRSEKARRLINRNFTEILDKQDFVEQEKNNLGREIHYIQLMRS